MYSQHIGSCCPEVKEVEPLFGKRSEVGFKLTGKCLDGRFDIRFVFYPERSNAETAVALHSGTKGEGGA